MIEQELNEIKKRLNKAIGSPWVADIRVGCVAVYSEIAKGKETSCLSVINPSDFIFYREGYKNDTDGWETYDRDERLADFIAHAPTDISNLLDEVERLRKENLHLIENEKEERRYWQQECSMRERDLASAKEDINYYRYNKS
jgi:hypothetical protein